MQIRALWAISLFTFLTLSSRSHGDYTQIFDLCLQRFNAGISSQCGMGPPSELSQCVERMRAASPNYRRDCEQLANEAASVPTENTAGEEIDTARTCVPAPGVTCPESGVPFTGQRPRGRSPDVGQASSPQQAPPQQAPDQAQAQNDLASCGRASTSAVNCCGSPLSCMSASERSSLTAAPTATGGGLMDACRQMVGLGGSSSTLNTRVSAICSGGQHSCYSTCGAMITKYQSLASNCDGCASQEIFDRTLQQLSASRSACSNLQSQVNSYAAQATESSSSQAYATNCLQSAGLGSGSDSSPSSVNDQDLYSCANNPTSLACQGQRPAALPQTDAGTSAFRETKGDARPTFNIDPTTGMEGSILPSSQGGGKPNSANVVANNAGGSIPGQGGGGSAKLDPARPSRAGGGTSTTSTDIMQGERSGGFTSPAGGSGFGDSGADIPAGARGRDQGLGDGTQVVGMDLKRYLPGGEYDPTRRLAGMAGRGQINGKSEDIFRIISNKMTEKCKLGVLWRCQ